MENAEEGVDWVQVNHELLLNGVFLQGDQVFDDLFLFFFLGMLNNCLMGSEVEFFLHQIFDVFSLNFSCWYLVGGGGEFHFDIQQIAFNPLLLQSSLFLFVLRLCFFCGFVFVVIRWMGRRFDGLIESFFWSLIDECLFFNISFELLLSGTFSKIFQNAIAAWTRTHWQIDYL